jgi:hypothetical protein
VGSYHYIDPHRFYKYLVWKNLCVKINLGSLFWKSQITWNRRGYQDNIFRKLIIAFFNEWTQGHKDLLIHNFVQHTSIFYTQTHIYASKSLFILFINKSFYWFSISQHRVPFNSRLENLGCDNSSPIERILSKDT